MILKLSGFKGGKMSKVVVLGGSFNPPTIAHEKLLSIAVDTLKANIGLFVPSSHNYVARKMRKQILEFILSFIYVYCMYYTTVKCFWLKIFNEYGRNHLKCIMIPSSVYCISKEAFKLYRKLESVHFQDDSRLNIVQDEAFAYCENITDLDLYYHTH